jgi:hypothetical protein
MSDAIKSPFNVPFPGATGKGGSEPKTELKSTLTPAFAGTGAKGVAGVYDHNVCPALSKPRDMGASAQSEKFFEDIKSGGPQTGLKSTMQNVMDVKTKIDY